jgi:AAA+ ATPase superfamily predicted ATPase
MARPKQARSADRPPKPADLVDRDREWQRLATTLASQRPELALVLGRRRIGKSFLLSRFARDAGGLYFQATRRTESEQLSRLSRAVGDHFEDTALQQGVGFPDWEALFGYITERAQGGPFLLVLDEFPNLTADAPALPSIIQKLWDHDWQNTKMKLVLSGSHITAMRQLEAVDQPLYGRRTQRLVLMPFGAREVSAFVPDYSVDSRLLAYGVVGGLPGHLRMLNPALDLAANAAELLLDPAGRLADEAQHMLDAFLGDAAVHYSIIEAIAMSDNTWKGITSRVGRSGGAQLRPIEWLIDMHVIARTVPITESAPQKSRRTLYRITDPYVSFWHRFVAPLNAAGSIGLVEPQQLWASTVAPRLDDYMGGIFESICRQAVYAGDLTMPFTPVRVGEWWDAASREQIHLVALGGNGELFAAECKWGVATGADMATLDRRTQLLAAELGGVRSIHLALFAAGGEFDAAVVAAREAGRVLTFTGADLLG